MNFSNTVIANSGVNPDCKVGVGGWGGIGTNINNLVEDGSCSAMLSGDPKLSVLADYGGLTQTIGLLNGSIAIDSGDDVTCASAPVNQLDQRGMSRLQSAHCDIGAYEQQTSPHLVFSYVPPYGTAAYPYGGKDILTGQAHNVMPSDYHIVCYVYVPESVPYGQNGWWIKPHDYVYNNRNLWESPIQPDSTWGCDIATGGHDPSATIVEAYLVPEAGKLSTPPTRAWLASNAAFWAVETRNPVNVRPWPMYGHDESHSGYGPVNGPNSANLFWIYNLGVPIQDNASPVIGVDGTIFMPSNRGLFAIDSNGTLKWKIWDTAFEYPLIHSAPAVGISGAVYVTNNNDNMLYSLNPADGTTNWSYPLGRTTYGSPTVGEDGTIYIGNAPGDGSYSYLVALNPDNTPDVREKWSWNSGSECWIESSPAIGPNGEVYFHHNCLGTVALDSNGQYQWAYPAGEAWNSPSTGLDGTIYIGNSDHEFYGLNPDGSLQWTVPVGNFMYESSSAISPDGSTIYRGDNGGIFYAFNKNGSVKWQYDTGILGTITSAPALTYNGIIYFTQGWTSAVQPNDRGYVYALRADDGSLLWKYEIGWSSSSPALGADGTLYVAGTDSSNNGVLYAIECADRLCQLPNRSHSLVVAMTGTGSGTVTSDPAGIDCGVTCSFDFDTNTIIILNPSADPGSNFAGWNGDPDCSDGQVTMDASKTCTATFNSLAVLGQPSGSLSSWDESFAWTGMSEATWYELEVQTVGGTQMFDVWYTNASAGCETDTSCVVTPAEAVNIVNGEYQWRVRDYGTYGYGSWTGWQSFTPPANVVLGDPVGALTSWDRSFKWTGVSAATYYYLQVQTASGGPVFDAWYTSGEAGCEGGTSCGITPNQALHMSSGEYRWRLLDYGGYGYGRWTAWRGFSLDVPVASVSLGEPVDELTSWDHSFRWTGFPDGTWYYLMVQTASGTAVFDAWYTSPEAGCEGDTSCGISPVQALHLANGEYQWRILDYGMYGYGNWTEWQGFSLDIPPVGGVLGEPVGEKTSWDHRFDWTGYPDSTWYFLQVQQLDGTPVFDAWYLSGQAGCDVDTSCVIAPAQALRLANGRLPVADPGLWSVRVWELDAVAELHAEHCTTGGGVGGTEGYADELGWELPVDGDPGWDVVPAGSAGQPGEHSLEPVVLGGGELHGTGLCGDPGGDAGIAERHLPLADPGLHCHLWLWQLDSTSGVYPEPLAHIK